MIILYNILTLALLPLYLLMLLVRIVLKKEDPSRIKERFGFGGGRVVNSRRLIWLHAASIGESMAAMTLIENINKKIENIDFLITTCSLSSYKMLAPRLKSNIAHRFLPFDNIIFVRCFLKNWRPNLGIFIESEIWPSLINETAKNCKLLLFNATLSDRSYNKWSKFKSFFNFIMSNFTEIVTENDLFLKKYQNLGLVDIKNYGNIKYANKKLEVDQGKLATLSKHFAGRKIILFASTHFEDEQVAIKTIKPIRQLFPNSYFILVPRHPERTHNISKACTNLSISYKIASRDETPSLSDDLYIVDQFGVLGLFFSLAHISFIGGSFKHGVHNILEPAYFGNIIIFGPNISSMTSVALEMIDSKAAVQIHNTEELMNQMEYFLAEANNDIATKYKINAMNFIEQQREILDNYLKLAMDNL